MSLASKSSSTLNTHGFWNVHGSGRLLIAALDGPLVSTSMRWLSSVVDAQSPQYQFGSGVTVIAPWSSSFRQLEH